MLTAYAAAANSTIPGETASKLAQLFELMISKIPLWIAAFVIMILSFVVAKIARSIVENKMAEKGIEEEHKEVQILGGRMTYTVILTLGLTIALKIAGIDLTTIIAAVAFGIGFALKDLIMNFLAGVMILVGRHFTIGDFIRIGGTLGRVMEIQSRVTILQAIDGTRVIVPNAELFSKQVTSLTSNPFRRVDILIRVEYRSNLENILKIAAHVLKNSKGVLLEPKPNVLIYEFGEGTVTIKLRAWVASRGGWLKIKSEIMMNLKREFHKHDIAVPFPLRNIIYDKDEKYEEKLFEEIASVPGNVNDKSSTKSSVVDATPGAPSAASASTSTSQEPALAPAAVENDEFEQPLKPLNEA